MERTDRRVAAARFASPAEVESPGGDHDKPMNRAANPEQERRVIELRYGIDGGAAPVSATEAGRRLGVSAERIRKLEEALHRLALEREIAALTEEAA